MKKRLAIVGLLIIALSVNGYAANAVEIYLKTLVGKTIVLQLDVGNSIEEVRIQIENRTGVPPNKQFLYFGEKLLSDGRTLADYNIQKDSLLTLRPDPPIAENSARLANEALAAQQRQQNEFLSILMLVPVIAALSLALSRLLFTVLLGHK